MFARGLKRYSGPICLSNVLLIYAFNCFRVERKNSTDKM